MANAREAPEGTVDNRLAEIMKAKGLTLEDLAEMTNRSVSAMGRIERGENKMRVQDLLQLAAVLGVAPHDIVPALTPKPAAGSLTGFCDDVVPYKAGNGGPEMPLGDHRFRHTVTSNVLDAIGIAKGSDVVVDIGQEAVDGARTGDAVLIRYTPPGGTVTTLIRQYVEPGLFVANSRSEPAAVPLNDRTDDVQLVGVIVEMIQRIQRR